MSEAPSLPIPRKARRAKGIGSMSPADKNTAANKDDAKAAKKTYYLDAKRRIRRTAKDVFPADAKLPGMPCFYAVQYTGAIGNGGLGKMGGKRWRVKSKSLPESYHATAEDTADVVKALIGLVVVNGLVVIGKPPEASETAETAKTSDKAPEKPKPILKAPKAASSSSNGAGGASDGVPLLPKLVNDAKQKITALDAEMASQRAAFITKRRTELDAAMDPLLSDEAAGAQAGANFVTARKEAMAKFPSSAESDELKNALADYEAKAAELVELESKLKSLVEPATGSGGLGGSSSARKRKRASSD